MALGYVDDNCFKDIANAIRNKTGSVSNYYPGDMSNAINNISVGGANLGTKSVTSNGIYNASDDSLDGYNTVTVAVPMPTFNTDVLNVSANGVYNAITSGLDGYSEVNVQVPSSFNSTDLTVTSNGVYNAQLSGYDGYVEVNVQVPGGGADLSNFVTALDENNQPIGMNGLLARVENIYTFNKPVVVGDGVTSISGLFSGCGNFNSPVTIGNNVKSCYSLFYYCNNFNQPINIPDATTHCNAMFEACNKFNSPIKFSNNCINYERMFYSCSNFNQPVMFSNKANSLKNTFARCYNFNQPIYIQSEYISGLDDFLNYCNNFNSSIEIHGNSNYVANINAGYAFADCFNLNSPVIFDVAINSAQGIFYNCQNLNAPVQFADPKQSTTNFYQAFKNCYKFNQPINIPYNAHVMNMFERCNSLDQDLEVTFGRGYSFSNTFRNCLSIGGNIYIDYFSPSSAVQMVNTILHNRVLNIYSFNVSQFIKTTAAESITGTDITWSEMTNGYYNEAYNIYVYNNYLGIIWDSAVQKFQNNAQFNLPIRIGEGLSDVRWMINNCPNFNSPISLSNTVYLCTGMLKDCVNFNQPITFPNKVNRADNCMENCVSMKSDIIICNNTVNCENFLANANYEGNIYYPNGWNFYGASGGYSPNYYRMFYGKTNDTNMINLYTINTFSQCNYNYNNKFTGKAEEWVREEDNHLVYSPTANIYIHTDWDGVIPS